LNREGRLTAALRKDLKELDGMRVCPADIQEAWFAKVQERLSKIADEGIAESSACRDVPEIKKFIDRPTADHIAIMRDGLVKTFSEKRMPIRESTEEFVNGIVDAIEGFSTDEFQDDLRTFMIRNYEIVGKAQDAVEGAAFKGYRLVHAILNTTYKGASIFGGHYKKQLICATGKKKCKQMYG